MNFKLLVFIAMLFSSPAVFACICSPESLTEIYQKSHVVAKVKILKLTPDAIDQRYHHAAIEMVTLYKGEPLTKIYIESELNTSCAFLPSINSTWIIFASVWQGKISFGMCSGSIQLDTTFDTVLYPNATENHDSSVKMTQQILQYLSDHDIQKPNPIGLFSFNEGLNTIKGYNNDNKFAVFQVDVNADLSVNKIKTLTKFQNNKLTKAVLYSMKSDLKFVKANPRVVSNPNKIIIFCYFHKNQNDEYGYVSLIN